MSLNQDNERSTFFPSAKAQKVESEEQLLLQTKKLNTDLESVEILIFVNTAIAEELKGTNYRKQFHTYHDQ